MYPETLHLHRFLINSPNKGKIRAMLDSIKSIKRVLYFAALMTFLLSCTDENRTQKVEEVETNGKISSIIRSPVTMDGPIDTIHVAKMSFQETVFEFGEVREGETVEHEFHFTNTGKVPLVINNAQSTCGCTVPEWPKVPIEPGQKGSIKVNFDTENRLGFQEKPITITANIYPSPVRIYLRGKVI